MSMRWIWLAAVVVFVGRGAAAEAPDRTMDLWGETVPGETALSRGEALPTRPTEKPPATRITKITQPTLEFYEPPAEKRTGRCVLIFPGGTPSGRSSLDGRDASSANAWSFATWEVSALRSTSANGVTR